MSKSPIFRHAQVRLRDFIRSEGLKPGDRLPAESVLADTLGVSKATLREATRSLQTLGVIEARHGNGLFVSAFSFQPLVDQLPYELALDDSTVRQIVMARGALEVGLMPAVTALGDTESLTRCADLAAEMARLEARGESCIDVDREFHVTLYEGLGNALVTNLIELFWDLYARVGEDAIAASTGGRATRHLAIVEAIRSGDELAAIERMQEHFEDLNVRAGLIKPVTAERGSAS